MSAGNSPSPEASPSRAWEDSRRLRKSESKRSRSMLDLTDAAISQPVQGERIFHSEVEPDIIILQHITSHAGCFQ